MPHYLLYTALALVVIAAGVVNQLRKSSAPLLESSSPVQEAKLANCDEAILAARRTPYWRNLTFSDRFAVDCRPAPGGWQLTANMTTNDDLCQLYVGRDRLIVPRLPCQGVGARELDSF